MFPRECDTIRIVSHGPIIRLLLDKKQRRKLGEIIPPVDPGVAARAFLGNDLELVLLEHGGGGIGGLEQEVFLAAAEPDQMQAFFESGVVQSRPVAVYPLGVRRFAAEPARDAEIPELNTPM